MKTEANEREEIARREIEAALETRDQPGARRALSALSAPELAPLLESLPEQERLWLWAEVPSDSRGEVLVEVHRDVRAQLVSHTLPGDLMRAVSALEIDELADIDAQLPPAVIDAVVQAMDIDRRRRFDAVRHFPDDSAGGLMNVDAVVVRADLSLGAALDYLRRLRGSGVELPEPLDALIVIDRDERYVGMLPLSALVSLELGSRVHQAMRGDIEGIPADTPAREVATRFQDQDLLSAAVVDDDGRLLGRITVDDVVDVLQEETERALMHPSGLDVQMDLFAPVAESVRRRGLWLAVHLLGAFAAAWVIARFDAAIERLVALAILMPMVASMGGVAGSQTLALVVRGLALEQVDRGNWWRLLVREGFVALGGAMLWSVAVGLVAVLWFGNVPLAWIAGIALAVNLLAAATSGVLIPVLLQRAGIDPALGSGVLLTIVTDAAGFLSFLGLATLFVVR